MNRNIKTAIGAAAFILASQAMAQITFYQNEDFRGRPFATSNQVVNFKNAGFNDRASSVVVDRGRWEVCEDANFQGRCVVLRQGSYASLNGLGLNDRVSSVRKVNDRRQYANEAPAPLPAPTYAYRQRPNERIYQAPVTSVRAVVGPPEQRCWVERQQVAAPVQNNANVGGALVGAVIGGVLGHQVGGGRGKDLATAGGAVAGAVVGSNVGSSMSGGQLVTQDVRRCENVTSTVPQYWDVTYNFRRQEHRIQMSTAPGATIAVNRNGEPRQ